MPRKLDREQLRRLLEQRTQLVETLPAREYEQEHLPGAISLPLRRIETEATATLDPSRSVVVYCWDSA
jgi:rhodanese-related sulfurtransferase